MQFFCSKKSTSLMLPLPAHSGLFSAWDTGLQIGTVGILEHSVNLSGFQAVLFALPHLPHSRPKAFDDRLKSPGINLGTSSH